REGPLGASVVLAASDPAVPTLELHFRCYIQPKVEIDPPILRFTDVSRGQLLEGQVRLMLHQAADQTRPPVLEAAGSPPAGGCGVGGGGRGWGGRSGSVARSCAVPTAIGSASTQTPCRGRNRRRSATWSTSGWSAVPTRPPWPSPTKSISVTTRGSRGRRQ